MIRFTDYRLLKRSVLAELHRNTPHSPFQFQAIKKVVFWIFSNFKLLKFRLESDNRIFLFLNMFKGSNQHINRKCILLSLYLMRYSFTKSDILTNTSVYFRLRIQEKFAIIIIRFSNRNCCKQLIESWFKFYKKK